MRKTWFLTGVVLLIVFTIGMVSRFVSLSDADELQGEAAGVSDLIRVETPRSGDAVASPLRIRGEARGNWYFEANFPIRLFDANGKELAVLPVQAQGDWMTTNFVPFDAIMKFPDPETETGTLVLEKDNPSGLPEYAAELRIPVRFAPPAPSSQPCRATGCSGQVCADEAVMTTCEYRAEYGCYKTARCERQASGACGWTETAELSACLREAGYAE